MPPAAVQRKAWWPAPELSYANPDTIEPSALAVCPSSDASPSVFVIVCMPLACVQRQACSTFALSSE
jgi:hypothetical protein